MPTPVREGTEAAQRGRTLIMWALGPYREGYIAPLQAFTGRSRNQKPLGLRNAPQHPLHQAGLSPTAQYATESRPSLGSKPPPGGLGNFGAQEVLTAIAQLPPIDQNWVNHRYRHYGHTKLHATQAYAQLLWHNYRHVYLTNTREKTKRVAQHLVYLQVMYSSYPLYWSEDRPREIDDQIHEGNLTMAAWNKTYAPHWRAIRKLMQEIDERACAGVCRLV